MPATSAAPSTAIRYTFKVKKTDLGRGRNSKTGALMPGIFLMMPDRKTILAGTYIVTTPDDNQRLFPTEVTETLDDYVVTGTLSSGHYPPLTPQGELELFRLSNKYKEIEPNHYEFFQAHCRLAPPGLFRDEHPFITDMTEAKKITKLLNDLTSEYLDKSIEWHYDPKKNSAWLENLSEADLNKVKNELQLDEIVAILEVKTADKPAVLIIKNISVAQLDKLTNSGYHQIFAEQSRPRGP
jgi:hypothetical protein